MPVGYVYVLSNPEHPGLFKIGYTTDPVEARAATLSASSGVLAPFLIEYWRLTLQANEIENIVHAKFKSSRKNPKREFFSVNLDEIIAEIEKHVTEPPIKFRRESPKSKVDTRYVCKRCGHKFERAKNHTFCPKCGY